MKTFEYQWWTVQIQSETGVCTWEFKGKDKDHVIKQITKEVTKTNSPENLKKSFFQGRKERIIKVFWETLKLDRTGFQRLS